ncbi:MAG: hypothetical protein ACRESZ_06610, partial [Methylococcales bacterium]
MNYQPLKNRVSNMTFPGNMISFAVIAMIALISTNLLFGINDAGERTVVQYPTGTLYIKFSPGIYFKGFGSTEVYWDVYTYDFDKAGSA